MTVLPGRKTVLAVNKQGGRMAGFYSSSNWYKKLCISLVIVYDSLFYNLIKQLSHKLIPESELQKNQLVLADGHACLGKCCCLLVSLRKREKIWRLPYVVSRIIAARKMCYLTKQMCFTFLERHTETGIVGLVKILWILVRSHLKVFNKLLWCDTVLK